MRLLVLALVACSSPPKPVAPPPPEIPAIELVETQPTETTLDSDLRDAHVVWLEMIQDAKQSLDFAEFYASNAPNSRLEPIVVAIEAAAKRGVHVRFLAEISFVREYSDTLDRMQKAGVNVRTYDLSTATRGILHAKYFVVDKRTGYLGSQNFDWRAIEHIEELGARLVEERLAQDLARLFEADWKFAGGEDKQPWLITGTSDTTLGRHVTMPGAGMRPPPRIRIVASPQDLLPGGIEWELPQLVAMIGSARQTIRVQLLTYHAADDDGTTWTELEQPLVAAAARGVTVELLLADWVKRDKTIGGIQKLARTPNVKIKLVTIPEHSSGFIPFARVIHAKLLVVDDDRAWIGSSNWEREYFYKSRNVGLVFGDPTFAERIARWSDATWNSSYAIEVDPDVKYTPPRIK